MTIRKVPAVGCSNPAYYAAHCVRCGEYVAQFFDPDFATEAIQAAGGEIVVDAHCIDDCVVACENCAGKCVCQRCGKLLEADLCPDACTAPQDIREFIAQYPGDLPGMSVIACTVVVDIGKGELIALGESTGHVWGRIKDYSYPVAGVLYAGDDRNQAIQTQEAWNQKYYRKN